jgi:hypothetical protein
MITIATAGLMAALLLVLAPAEHARDHLRTR